MIVGILIDHFGWFGVPANPVSITRTLGVAIMIFAISLVQPKKKKDFEMYKVHYWCSRRHVKYVALVSRLHITAI